MNPKLSRKRIATVIAGAAVVTAGTVGAAGALSDDGDAQDRPIPASGLEQAEQAALEETGGNVMDSVFYTDLQLRWTPEERFNFALGVNNLFDKQPPILGDNQQQANTYPSTYDPYGRAFFVSTNVKF